MNRHSKRRGMTLLEVSVSAGVGVVVLGMILFLFVKVQSRTDQQIATARAMTEATHIADWVVHDILNKAYPPESLNAGWPSQAPEQYASGIVQVYSTAGATHERLPQFCIKNEIAKDADGVTSRAIRLGVRSVPQAGAPVTPYAFKFAGANRDFNSEIEFNYINQFDDMLDFNKNLLRESKIRPRYIRYVIGVWDKKGLMGKNEKGESKKAIIASGVAF